MKYLNKTITVNYNPINIGNNLEKKGYKTNKNLKDVLSIPKKH